MAPILATEGMVAQDRAAYQWVPVLVACQQEGVPAWVALQFRGVCWQDLELVPAGGRGAQEEEVLM